MMCEMGAGRHVLLNSKTTATDIRVLFFCGGVLSVEKDN